MAFPIVGRIEVEASCGCLGMSFEDRFEISPLYGEYTTIAMRHLTPQETPETLSYWTRCFYIPTLIFDLNTRIEKVILLNLGSLWRHLGRTFSYSHRFYEILVQGRLAEVLVEPKLFMLKKIFPRRELYPDAVLRQVFRHAIYRASQIPTISQRVLSEELDPELGAFRLLIHQGNPILAINQFWVGLRRNEPHIRPEHPYFNVPEHSLELNALSTFISTQFNDWVRINQLRPFAEYYSSRKTGLGRSLMVQSPLEVYYIFNKHKKRDPRISVISPKDPKLAWDLFRARLVCTYTLKEENFNGIREIEVLKRLQGYPYMAQIRHDMSYYSYKHRIRKTRVIMDYYPAGDLFERLEVRPLSMSQAVHVFGQILAGVKRLHAMGAIHRNLKLEGVYLEEDETGALSVYLAGFEFTKMPRFPDMSPELGTALYYSPEYARASISKDEKGKAAAAGTSADVWALGVIAYLMFNPGRDCFWVNRHYRPETQVLQLSHLDSMPPFPVGTAEEAFIARFLKLEPRPSLDQVIDLFQRSFHVNVA